MPFTYTLFYIIYIKLYICNYIYSCIILNVCIIFIDFYDSFDISLTVYCRPIDAILAPLGARDQLFEGEQSYTLLLKYSFSLVRHFL